MINTIMLYGRVVEYELQRKKVKNINLRIKSDGSVNVSAPPKVPLDAIEEVLRSNGAYILKALDKFSARNENAPQPLEYKDGEYMTVLGYRVPIEVVKGNRNVAEMTSRGILLTVKDTDNIEIKQKTINSFLEDVCRRTVLELCEKTYPVFEDAVKKYPTIKLRRMHTKWGICRPTRNEITFSYMLASVPVECIEYVVYHEFNHFIHPDHSKAFYQSLEKFLPDWKDRKKRLGDFEIIK